MSVAGVVLAGGGSVRMGTAKAGLEWHGSTLLRRTVGVLGRVVAGPIVVVRAPGQQLPALPATVRLVDDPAPGLGPVQGLAAGLAALTDRAEAAFVAATDLPLLHPAFVARVLQSRTAGVDLAIPRVHGHPQPLAAAYRVGLAPACAAAVTAGRLRLGELRARLRTRWLDEAALLADPALAAADPHLESVCNVNRAEDYAAARARPAPEVTLRRAGRTRRLPAATLGAAVPQAWRDDCRVWINGAAVPAEPDQPLVTGDVVVVGEPNPTRPG